MKVQMRLRRISGIANETDHLPPPHFVAKLYSQRAWLQVRVKRKVPAADVQNNVVSANRLQGDRYCTRILSRNILRYAILCFGNDSVRHGKGFGSVSEIILVVLFI